MNTTFSFKRLGLLLNRFFIENKQKELIFWGIAILVFTLMHEPEPATIFIYISGFLFAARQFKIFSYTPSGMHYLLIPATHTEKLTASILLSTVYFFVMSLITYCIGNIIGTSIINYVLDRSMPISWELFSSHKVIGMNLMLEPTKNQFWELLTTFLQVQSVFILGSLYFKRNAVGKTLLTFAVMGIVFGLFQLFLMDNIWSDIHNAGSSISMNVMMNNSAFMKSMDKIADIFFYLLIPYFWLVSYFRLKEKQV